MSQKCNSSVLKSKEQNLIICFYKTSNIETKREKI